MWYSEMVTEKEKVKMQEIGKRNTAEKSRIPMLGAAYYPEAWDEKEQEKDIALMVKTGIKVVRMGEFAWHKMEPKCGEFHFEWLHRVMDRLEKAGIAVMLGTPTATPPVWLEDLDRKMMVLDENGRYRQHGGRRNICSNNPTYIKYSKRLVERFAQEFGKDPRVVCWQIDNEINILDNGCYCEYCRKGFADYLEKKYGTIDNLNQRWGLELFSQAYDSFEQVPMPKPYVWHGAHIKYEWLLYQAQAHIDFIKMQAQILHRYTDVPVGTDMMPILEMDYEKIAECTDIMQFNHYHDESNLWEAAFWFDYLRTFKEIPFWNTETSTCWNGGLYTPSNLRPEGFCRANSWLPLLLGGSVNMYWLWRQHRTGHELMHGSVLYASGRTMHIFGEVQETAAQIKMAADFLETTKVVTGTAMVVTTKNAGMMRCQPVTSVEEETGDRRLNFYRCLMNAGLRPDIISAGKDLDSYKLLFTPYVLTLEERNLAEKIEKWVKDGGVWVAGPMTDIRDSIGAHYTDSETGMLERLTGSQLVQQIPDHRHHIRCEWQDGTEFKACNFLQLFEIPEDAEALAAVKSGFSTLVGQKVLFSKKVGKGLVIVLGTMPGPEDMEKVLKLAIEESGVSHFEFTGDIVAAVRSSIPLKTAQKDSGSYDRIPPCSETEQGSMVTKRGIVAQAGITGQEISGRTGTLKIDGTMTDLLTDRVYTDVVPFEPYQTVVLV